MPRAVMKDATSLRPVPPAARPSTRVRNRPVAPVTAAYVESESRPTSVTAEASDGEMVEVDPRSGEVLSPRLFTDQPQPSLPAFVSAAPVVRDGLGTREEIQDELDAIAEQVRQFHLKQPDQVMRECAAYTARLTELCVLLHRVEALDRQYTRVRTQQVERWLAELERQFKYASRIVEIMRQDIQLSGAGT